MAALFVVFCRFLLIFLIAFFIIMPLFKNLVKICFKKYKAEKQDILEFIETERKGKDV